MPLTMGDLNRLASIKATLTRMARRPHIYGSEPGQALQLLDEVLDGRVEKKKA